MGERNNLFPVFLKLQEMKVLIVGGGNVGLEKLQAIISNSPGTVIHLVSKHIRDEIKELASGFSNIRLSERVFLKDDIDEVELVFIAVDDYEESSRIAQLAKEKGKLVNVADKPALCDFYLSSVVQKQNLKIAISTNGKSPTIAKRLKEMFNELLPDELDAVLDDLQQIRERLKGDFSEKVNRLNQITKELRWKE
ncbi:MAG: bifunctional precorrin-2 dehydrogenase/sirohydrochlorin ferrochelatase [Flavisolibacter sp.]